VCLIQCASSEKGFKVFFFLKKGLTKHYEYGTTGLNKRDPSKLFVPSGYKIAARLDRTRNGGGLMLMCEDHLLVDSVDCSVFNTPGQAEMICVDFLGQY
jgi:hypothetical protein